jgi:hypothetical protein
MPKHEFFINIFSSVFLLLAIFLFLYFPRTITLAATTVGCGVYWGGDWIIPANTYCGVVNEVIAISKNLVLQTGSTLELNGTTNLIFGFKYRKPITISNPGVTLTNYTVLVTVDTQSLISAGKMRSDCGDIRFGDAETGAIYGYPYWIEEGTCNTANTRIWVKLTTIPAGSKTIYIFYGNPTATSISDGNKVFLFFDDFSTADTSKFTYGSAYCGYNPLSYSVSNGKLTVWSDGASWRILRAIMDTGPGSWNATVVTKFNASAASYWYQNYFVQLDACDQNRYGWQDNGALGWRIQMKDGTGYTYSNAIATLTANTWYIDEIRRNSTGCFRGKIYNSGWGLLGSHEVCNSVWSGVTWTWVTWQYQTTQVQYDWIFIRLSVAGEDLEPTANVGTTEESNLPQYIYIYSGGKLYIYPPAGINKPS